MSTTINHINGDILHTTETSITFRSAVIEAVAQGADLRDAHLQGAGETVRPTTPFDEDRWNECGARDSLLSDPRGGRSVCLKDMSRAFASSQQPPAG